MVHTLQTLDIGESHRLQPAELPSFISQQVSEARRYYFNLSPSANSGIKIVLGGCERVRADYVIQRPKFPYYSIEFVAEGKGRAILAGQEFNLMSGSVFGYGPNSPLEIFASSRDLMTKYYVTFLGRSAKRMLKIAGLESNQVKQIRARHQLSDIFEMMISNGLASTRFSHSQCASLLHCLALKIAEQTLPNDVKYARALETYLRVREQIDKHFLEMKNIEQTAAHCCLTVSYICQLFKRFDHLTPYHYLLRQRMQFAADLLSNPGILIKQVARRLDFADQFQFSRAFKRVLGISPAQFQKEHTPTA